MVNGVLKILLYF